jgi:predicted heme/steroid binding protein
MIIPEKIVTINELKLNTGERNSRMWIAHNGLVFDVTDCPKWRTGLHEFLHFPGQDLTIEFPEAPHAEEVFNHECIKVVGKLEELS